MLRRVDFWLVGIVAAGSALAASFALRVGNWVVMTDELQTVRAAISIATTGSPVPRIHGEYYASLAQLYPLLAAPFYAVLSAPAAFRAVHGFGALLMASAAVPAYLLARAVGLERWPARTVAALTVAVPWLAMTTTVLSDVVAYPAFLWAVLFAQRTLVEPSRRNDVLLLAGLVLAFLARVQLSLLVPVVPVALLVHELRFGSFRRAFSRHAVLWAGYGAVAIAFGAVAIARSAGSVLGTYSGTVEGGLFPEGIWGAAARHLDAVVVGVAVVPFALAAGWVVCELVQPLSRRAHAFAVLAALLVPLLVLQVSSFDQRFAAGAFVQDRYLSYVAPLLFVGAGAWLESARPLRTRSAAALGAAGLFALLALLVPHHRDAVIFWAAPAGAFHWTGLARWGGLLMVVLVVAGMRLRPRATGVGLAAALLVFCLVETQSVFRLALRRVPDRPPFLTGLAEDWVDTASAGAPVTVVPSPYLPPEPWWDVELWNKQVDRALGVNGATTYTPFPAERAMVDPRSGELAVAHPTPLLVLSARETRFGLRGAREVAGNFALRLVRVAVPYRAAWSTLGTTPDGWTRPGWSVRLRLYSDAKSRQRRAVALTLSAAQFPTRHRYHLFAAGQQLASGRVGPLSSRTTRVSICVPAGGFADVTLDVLAVDQLPDGRLAGLHIDRVEEAGAGPCR